MKYTEWLKNIKGYTDKTIDIYKRYSIELTRCNGDYALLLNKYQDRSNASKRLILSAVKSYYIFEGDKRAKEIKLPKRNIVVSDFVSYKQYQSYLLNMNKKTKMGYQKYIIVRLLFETGIRSSELLWIKKQDIIENRIKIYGKGNKERYVFISKWLLSEIQGYLSSLNTDRLFNFGYKNLHAKIERIDKTRKLTPHMFRHGFAKYCNIKGISIYDISLSMGHSSIETTAKYINKNSEDVKIYTIF